MKSRIPKMDLFIFGKTYFLYLGETRHTSGARPPPPPQRPPRRRAAPGLTDVGGEGQVVHGGVQVDHVRGAALPMQVGRQSLRGHEEASGPAGRGGSAKANRQLPPAAPHLHEGGLPGAGHAQHQHAHRGRRRQRARRRCRHLPSTHLSFRVAGRGRGGGGGPTEGRHDARGTRLSPWRRRPGTHRGLARAPRAGRPGEGPGAAGSTPRGARGRLPPSGGDRKCAGGTSRSCTSGRGEC